MRGRAQRAGRLAIRLAPRFLRAMADPLPISCYIRTLNEARTIASVVEAALPVVAEVIVVDSLSTDATAELAEKAGARVIKQAWLGYGAQKRFAEDQCKHDWLLSLDADEIFTPALEASLRALFAHGEPPLSVYEVEIVTAPPFGLKPWWNFGQVYRDRLYDRRKIRIPDHAAWDQLDVPADMKVGKLKGALLHPTISDIGHFTEKLNKVSGVHAREAKLKPFWLVALRVLFAQPFYFIRHYVLRGLWRGGLWGYIVARASAHGRWLKDAKMMEIHFQNRQARRRND
jgi:glycosyltransferase involved in cell wall biosynthesis